jgi:HSP20 family protein
MFNLVPWKKEKNGSGAVTTRGYDHPLAQIREEFDTLFDRFFGRWPAAFAADFGTHFWGLDVDDTGNEVVVRAEAPGFEAEDFDVHVGNNVLTIRAERKQEGGEKESSYSERRSFQRSVTLPVGIDADKVEARYRNGVLELRLAKTEAAQPKRIEVKV